MTQSDPVKITGLADVVTTLKNSVLLQGQIYTAISSIAVAMAAAFPPPLKATASWTPGAVTNGSHVSTTLTVAGAAFGNTVAVAASVDIQDQILTAYVSAANTVTVVLQNNTGGTITLGVIALTVRILQN